MEAHLLTKIIHMTAVAAALMVCASTLFIGVQGEQPNPAGRKALVALQHLSFTVVFITGAILLVMKNFQVQPWFYAKIILFLVLLSSLMKAFKKDDTILLAQRRAGLVISAITFVAIIILVIVKPVFA
ncbi:SirB2 family protein [Acinetobacter baumannii]|uniref:SirB2 family protein n=1 Tax=Acinetobacter baumannii TaxID=470 RepID=UPI001F587C66|nr:SirB2 family protein [Acinetobacter baumannii]MCI2316453.1 SirB2 family protein [Acinetobacter baumannii]